jgi:hypothetical protein
MPFPALFLFSVYIIDTLFILGDGLTGLLLRWYLLLLRWKNLHRSFPAPGLSWAEPRD